MFHNIRIDLLILKTYYGQFTLTTKKSLHIIFNENVLHNSRKTANQLNMGHVKHTVYLTFVAQLSVVFVELLAHFSSVEVSTLISG